MKALAIIIQTKRGENAFVVTSNNFTQELAQEYSHAIYNIIIRSFKKSQRVDRTFLFKRDLSAICNISKDVIIQVIIPNNEVQYGVECLKKANELLTRHAKNETTLKKYTEIFYNLEELIYSRDYSLNKLQLTLKPSEIQSAKKSIDNDLFAKFPLLTHDGEKSLIQTVPLKYSKRAFTHHREAHIRYQVAKTCQFAVSPSVTQDSELKRFYKHNLSNNAFNKGKARPSMYGKAISRQGTIQRGSQAMPSKQLSDIDDDHEEQPRPMYQMPGIKGYSDLNPSAAMPVYDKKPTIANVMDLYSSISAGRNPSEDINKSNAGVPSYMGVSQTNSLYGNIAPEPQGERQRRKIFESTPEKKDGSFNTFSHDMFNTVNLPAQIIEVQENPSKNKFVSSYDNVSPSFPGGESLHQSAALQPSFNRLDQYETSSQPGGFNNQGEVSMSMSTLPNEDFHTVAYIKLLKIMEKFYLTLQNSKVQSIKIVGQVALEVDDNDGLPPLSLYLAPSHVWDDESKIAKRPSRKEFFVGSVGSMSILQLGRMRGNVPLYDYLVTPKSFDTSKIPMFFIYKIEDAGPDKYNILMQYKINEKLNQTFYEVEISVNFKTDITRFNPKAMPNAQKIEGRSINWKTKSLAPDSKGKLCVMLEYCNMPISSIFEEIKIVLKGLTVAHEEMMAYASFQPNVSPQLYQDPNVFKPAQKRQIIEYKILPNTQ